MSMLEKFVEQFGDYQEEFLFADGFDEAIVGLDTNSGRVVYNQDKMIEILMQDMSEEEAMEYLEYNVLNAYVGEHTPIYIQELITQDPAITNTTPAKINDKGEKQ